MTKLLSGIKHDATILWQGYKAGYYNLCGTICWMVDAKDISKCLDEIAVREFMKGLEHCKKHD